MKSLNKYIQEKLIINKDYHDTTIVPKSFDELRKIIEDRYDKLGPGTKQKPIDFNDVDVSRVTTFYDEQKEKSIFEATKFEYIDISDWNVLNAENMSYMFWECKNLKSVGDLSEWDVSKVKNIRGMFKRCEKLQSVGNISNWKVSKVIDAGCVFEWCTNLTSVGDLKWDVSKVEDMSYMFYECKNLTSVGDLSNWDVSNIEYMDYMFYNCLNLKSVGDLSKWDVSNVKYMNSMFDNSGITNKPSWYKG